LTPTLTLPLEGGGRGSDGGAPSRPYSALGDNKESINAVGVRAQDPHEPAHLVFRARLEPQPEVDRASMPEPAPKDKLTEIAIVDYQNPSWAMAVAS